VPDQPTEAPQPEYIRQRNEDFTTLYANNVLFEPSVWDLKLIFGELDQSTVPNVIAQHTAVSISWLQAKLMSYFLQGQIAAYEADNGTIRVPPAVIPPRPNPEMPEVTGNEAAKWVLKFLGLVHKRYFGEIIPAAAPSPAEPNQSEKNEEPFA
jgi:hypothetical protein